jgi:hypothetical protein
MTRLDEVKDFHHSIRVDDVELPCEPPSGLRAQSEQIIPQELP